jgi:hypothetical protein
MRRMIAAVLVSLAVSGPAWGMDGNKLYSYCSDTSRFESGVCMGVIVGNIDAMKAISTYSKSTKWLRNYFCLPLNATNGQLVEIVIKYLKGHPETRHTRASDEIYIALQKAFPCKR